MKTCFAIEKTMSCLSLYIYVGCDGFHYSLDGFMESVNYPIMPAWYIKCNRTLLLPGFSEVKLEFQALHLCDGVNLTVSNCIYEFHYIHVRLQMINYTLGTTNR